MTTPMLSTTADLMPLLPELVLIGGAMLRAQPGANPDYRPPSSASH